jgi:excisionase family DNA binding protein
MCAERGARNHEIMSMNEAAEYIGVSRSHLSHILAGKVAGVPPIAHVRAGRRNLIRRAAIDQWLSDLEQRHVFEPMAVVRSDHPESTPAPSKETS